MHIDAETLSAQCYICFAVVHSTRFSIALICLSSSHQLRLYLCYADVHHDAVVVVSIAELVYKLFIIFLVLSLVDKKTSYNKERMLFCFNWLFSFNWRPNGGIPNPKTRKSTHKKKQLRCPENKKTINKIKIK